MKSESFLGTACALALAAIVVACSTTHEGLQGPPGPPGPTGETAVAVDSGLVPGDSPQVSERAQRGFAISPVTITLAGKTLAEAEQLGQGSYLVNAVCSCSDCHTPAGPGPLEYLAGGTAYAVDNGAVVYARNLTPDATGMRLTREEFVSALTTGNDFAGSGNSTLLVMAWSHFRWMSPTDLDAMYAYLRAVPAVSNRVPADSKGASKLDGPPASAPPAKYDEGDVVRLLPPTVDAQGNPVDDQDSVMRGLAIRPLDAPTDATLATLSADEQARLGRGAYLANAAQCSDCHTNPPRLGLVPGSKNYLHVDTANYLTGGRVFQVPAPLQTSMHQVRTMSANLTGTANGFLQEPGDDFDRFLAIVQSGTHADESVNGEAARGLGWPMPWQDFRNMTLPDLEALYAYLKSLPTLSGAADKETSDYARYCATAADCEQGESCSNGECAGAACTAGHGGDMEPDASIENPCNACQPCMASRCAAPGSNDACTTQGI
jgi:hypothetical protein